MKRAMWRADPEGGKTFSNRTDPSQMVMFERSPNLLALRRMLQEQFGRKGWIQIEDVEMFVLLDTPFSEQIHLKRLTLGPMEREKLIQTKRPRGSQNRIGAYPPGTALAFLDS
jgi:hypothetical protein